MHNLGDRLTWTGTGTVVSEEEVLVHLAEKFLNVANRNREVTYLRLDSGLFFAADTTGDEYGHQLTPAEPFHLPVMAGDVWADDNLETWYAVNMDFGWRKGLRMKNYSALGETVKSTVTFLSENDKPFLILRNGELIEN